MKHSTLAKYIAVTMAILVLVASLVLAACKPDTPQNPNTPSTPSTPSTPDEPDTPDTPSTPGTPSKKDITGVTFQSVTVEYDGQEHEITLSGTWPDDVSVNYTGNKGTDAGEYNATATLSGDGYNTLTLRAKLTITKKAWDHSGITFIDKTVEYDAKEHSIQIVGNPPSGITVTYLYDGQEATGVTAVGVHEVTAVLGGKNFEEYRLVAKLTIKATEEMLYAAYYNGKIYFQNNLDGNKLYSVGTSGNALSKVSSDTAQYLTVINNALYYYSGSLFTQTIKCVNSSGIGSVYSPGRATYLTGDGQYIYYAKTNLIDTKKENGIYKLEVKDGNAQAEAVRICTDKASDLAYYNGYIYYVNKSADDKLYRVSVNGTDAVGTVVLDKKVSDLIISDGTAYFTQYDTTVGSLSYAAAIFKLNLNGSDGAVKLTADKGAYLTKIGNYIYYINKDALTSHIFGKGIYRVNINESGNLTSEKVLEADEGDGYYSLTGDGTNLYYYRLADKHLYRLNANLIGTSEPTDLMRSFTVPEDKPTITAYPYSFVTEHDGEIYYANPLDLGTLYKYNPTTKLNVKVLSDSVSSVYFNGNYMYYCTYILTNYALWRVDLTQTDPTPEKISPHRYSYLYFEGDYLYAMRITSTYNNRIVKIDLNNLDEEETEIYHDKNVHVTQLFYIDGIFYFTINPTGSELLKGNKHIYSYDPKQNDFEKAVDTKLVSDNFTICNGKYYYYNVKDKTFNVANLDGTGSSEIKNKVEITDIIVADGIIYYTSTSADNTGIFAYNTQTQTTVNLTSKVGHGLTVYNGNLYFINLSITWTTDYPQNGTGDGHLYRVSITGGTAEKLA